MVTLTPFLEKIRTLDTSQLSNLFSKTSQGALANNFGSTATVINTSTGQRVSNAELDARRNNTFSTSTQNILNNIEGLKFLNQLPQINFANTLSNFENISLNRTGINLLGENQNIIAKATQTNLSKPFENIVNTNAPNADGTQGTDYFQQLKDGFAQVTDQIGPTGILLGAVILGLVVLKR